jgi:hypothetical protein
MFRGGGETEVELLGGGYGENLFLINRILLDIFTPILNE